MCQTSYTSSHHRSLPGYMILKERAKSCPSCYTVYGCKNGFYIVVIQEIWVELNMASWTHHRDIIIFTSNIDLMVKHGDTEIRPRWEFLVLPFTSCEDLDDNILSQSSGFLISKTVIVTLLQGINVRIAWDKYLLRTYNSHWPIIVVLFTPWPCNLCSFQSWPQSYSVWEIILITQVPHGP